MRLLLAYLRELVHATYVGWNRFWFTPQDPATLSLIRILAGSMLVYTHAVWGLALEDFFTDTGWLSPEAVGSFQGGGYAWSYLWYINSTSLLWAVHALAIGVLVLFTLGLFTRVTSILAFVITISYVNRAPGALFGLDQINALLAMYLMLGPSGARYSLDHWLANRHQSHPQPVAPSVGANLAIRLIQFHMCVIYLFAGLSKLQGPAWWNGTALWGAFANLEYQSLDMLWLVHYPLVINLLTLVSVAWEISYCVLVWPRLTRPIVVALSVPLHLGIAFCMGMVTFGLIMIVGNLAFVSPWLVRSLIEWPFRRKVETSDATERRAPADASHAAANARMRQAQRRKTSTAP
jgi:uncharacterized membrane protein YphA (DoxX/SURF4 family)